MMHILRGGTMGTQLLSKLPNQQMQQPGLPRKRYELAVSLALDNSGIAEDSEVLTFYSMELGRG
jgi:hypothetical protein